MNMAEIMGLAGMYKEAIDMISSIKVSQLPDYLHPYYYHVHRILYGLMADYAITDQEKKYIFKKLIITEILCCWSIKIIA